MLSNDQPTISKKSLVDIIYQFELPIKIDEFFHAMGRKENLDFSDFCLLFKSKNNEHNFIKIFGSEINQNSEVGGSSQGNSANIFPVTISKLR